MGVALPANKKACFGVHVSGSGIAPSSYGGACGPAVGIVSGFVPENSELTIMVPKGSNRKFELLVYLAETSASCPSIEAAISDSSSPTKTYSSGVVDNVDVNKDQQDLAITLNFPGESQSLAVSGYAQPASCSSGQLRASLLSNGDWIDSTNTVLALSSETNMSGWVTAIGDFFGIGVASSGSTMLAGSANQVALPENVRSFSRKPDTGVLYGLLENGRIVQITISGATSTFTELTAANCPFAAADCMIPEWMQSMSVGFDKNMFALDHGGSIYKIENTGPVATGVSVEPYVNQVSFY